MSELRNRMIQDLKLAGLKKGTGDVVSSGRSPVGRLLHDPRRTSSANGRSRTISSTSATTWAWPRARSRRCFAGLKFFYVNTLGYEWPLFTKKKSASRARSVSPTSAATTIAAA